MNVEVIKRESTDSFSSRKCENKKRVAAYCRVSTELDNQTRSLETQMETYHRLISTHSDWTLAGIYKDEESGTSFKHRKGFNRMIRNAENGKIDIILVKSVQRFARNTVDLLSMTRKLKQLGVVVYFEREKISTDSLASELMLTIIAAMAQEESHSISENEKWGKRKRFAAGLPSWVPTYGYRKVAEDSWIPFEDEARVIRKIFQLYLNGLNARMIRDTVEQEGIPAPNGSSKWHTNTIASLLKNEKYAGDVLMQKWYTIDHLSHKKVRNKGVVDQYFLQDHHEGLVSHEDFQTVQEITALRGSTKGVMQYPYYGFLICPDCGQPMVRYSLRYTNTPAWTCGGEPEYKTRGERTKCPPIHPKFPKQLSLGFK